MAISVALDPAEIAEGRIIPDVEKEKVQLYQADPVSGSPISFVKEVLVDLDSIVDDKSLDKLLTPAELNKVKEERARRGKMSGPNGSIVSGG